jgi:outer membrane protein OmpA-like peptidoglycan-associated protein
MKRKSIWIVALATVLYMQSAVLSSAQTNPDASAQTGGQQSAQPGTQPPSAQPSAEAPAQTSSQTHAEAGAKKIKAKGLITGRDGDSLTLKTNKGESLIVEINDATRVEEPKGLLKIRKKEMGFTALIPGLRVEVEGVSDMKDRVVADKIKFSKDDLKMAEAMQAGLTPTQQAVAANKEAIATNQQGIAANKEGIAQNQQGIEANRQQIEQNDKAVTERFNSLTDFETKGSTNVYFASGSKTISAKDKATLKHLVQEAANLKGYIIEVKGFADSSGNPAMNQELSMDRAQEVVAYLLQDCNVPARRVVAPGAMGESNPAAPNETSKGRSENRRVEVKVLQNRGLAGGGSS